MMNLKNVLIILFSSIFMSLVVGCSTFNFSKKDVWPIPPKPIIKHVNIIPVSESNVQSDGFYLSRTNAVNLADNMDELKAYILKLELLIDKMGEYYGAKTREYRKIEK